MNRDQFQTEITKVHMSTIMKTFCWMFIIAFALLCGLMGYFSRLLGEWPLELSPDAWFGLFQGVSLLMVYAGLWALLTMLLQVFIGIPLHMLLRQIINYNIWLYCLVGMLGGASVFTLFFIITNIPLDEAAVFWAGFGGMHGLVCCLIGWGKAKHLPLPRDIKP